MEPSTLYKATVFPTSPPLNSTFYPLKIGYQEKLIRLSVIGYRLLVIGYQEKINSVIGYSLSVIRKKSIRLSVTRYQLSGKNQFGYRLLVISYQEKTQKTRPPKGGTTNLVPPFYPLKMIGLSVIGVLVIRICSIRSIRG